MVLGCAAVLLAGCASMPDSGDVTSVEQSPRSEGESQVRVYGVPPQDGAQPTNIVRSFLDATTSDEADFRTATQYLAKSAKRTWRPFQVTNVLQERPKPEPKTLPNREDSNGYTVTLSGSQVAAVDDSHAYTPEEKPYRQTIHLIKEGGQWRIDRLPDGLVLGLSDFQRIYRSVNKYYFASYNSESGEPKANRNALVADPVYLRQRIKPITASGGAAVRAHRLAEPGDDFGVPVRHPARRARSGAGRLERAARQAQQGRGEHRLHAVQADGGSALLHRAGHDAGFEDQ